MKVFNSLAFAALVQGTCAADPVLHDYFTWSATINSTAVLPSKLKQHGHGTAAWQTGPGAAANRTAWHGNGQQFVADFDAKVVYFIGGQGGNTCQYTCTIETDTPCESQLDGNALCGFDYENKAKYVGDEAIGEHATHHFKYQDMLGPISMAQHDIYIDTNNSNVVRFVADFHPFEKEVGTITSDYTDFSTDVPSEDLFAVQNVKYCQEGDEDQCQDVTSVIAGMTALSKAIKSL